MATTSNYSWTTPDDTDLVKDGASAIRTLGSAIDTTVFNNAGAAVAKSLIDAEGDLIVGDAADAVQRLAIGSNGNVLTVDTTVDGKIKWAAPAAGSTFVGCALYDTSSPKTISNATNTTLTWNAEIVDSDGFHSTSTNTGRITIPAGKGGKYAFYLLQMMQQSVASYQINIMLYKNGAQIRKYTNQSFNSTSLYNNITFYWIDNASVGDYYEAVIAQYSGGTRDLYYTGTDNTYSTFSAEYLGA